jgi:hypothetical protein
MIRYSKRPKDRFAAGPSPHGDPSKPEVEKVTAPAELSLSASRFSRAQ